MASVKKKILKKLGPKLLFLFLIFIGLTCRKRIIGENYIEELKKEGKNWIYLLWHNNIAIASWVLRKDHLVIMASASEDGGLATEMLQNFGFETVRGSSSKGGLKAMLSIVKLIKSGRSAALTPDGPRGPKYELQKGTIVIAQKTGVPLVPIDIQATGQWVLNKSWDQHKLPKPFSTLIISIGKPIYVDSHLKSDDLNQIQKRVETEMNQNVQRANNNIC